MLMSSACLRFCGWSGRRGGGLGADDRTFVRDLSKDCVSDGTFAGYAANADAMLNVLRMHAPRWTDRRRTRATKLLEAAIDSWDTAVRSVRSMAFATPKQRIGSTGTISFLMDVTPQASSLTSGS